MEPKKPPQVGKNIQKIRKNHKMTLDVLAEKSGVSKAMLSQIESEKVNPTIATIWKIAQGLDVEINALFSGQEEMLRKFEISRKNDITKLDTDENNVHIRVFSPISMAEDLEMYMFILEPKKAHYSAPHAPRTEEFLTILEGRCRVTAGSKTEILEEGDFIYYHADIEHSLENLSEGETKIYMVVRFKKSSWE
ncbi:MAG: XRE family transcriptional regulator [Spirochaetes bacterium]|nr:MAG: XRE family transcriptional regulator [Spirochaetota bacterium]